MNLLILGLGEYGKLVKEYARNHFATIDFLDDVSKDAIGKLEDYKKLTSKYKYGFVSIGDNELRSLWMERLIDAGYIIPTIISDKAYVSPTAVIECGCIIEAMACINANSLVMKGSIISSGAVINHNAIVNKYCHIDCGGVVGGGTVVPEKMHLNYNQVITKVGKPINWEFSE